VHDFDFTSDTLQRLFAMQRHLESIELFMVAHDKRHDVTDCLTLLLRAAESGSVQHTLKRLVLTNFSITERTETESVSVLAAFVSQFTELRVLRWGMQGAASSRETCLAIRSAFTETTLKHSQITELELPPFLPSLRSSEEALYAVIASTLRLRKLYYSGDVSVVDWARVGAVSTELERLELSPSRTTNGTLTQCLSECGRSLRYLAIDTKRLATLGFLSQQMSAPSDELSNFVIPYFRAGELTHIEHIDMTVRFLEESSLFTFLSRLRAMRSLKRLTMSAQSFRGTMNDHDIRKHIGQFVGAQQFSFTLVITSQFVAARRVLTVCRLSEHKGSAVEIDKVQWVRSNVGLSVCESECVSSDVQT